MIQLILSPSSNYSLVKELDSELLQCLWQTKNFKDQSVNVCYVYYVMSWKNNNKHIIFKNKILFRRLSWSSRRHRVFSPENSLFKITTMHNNLVSHSRSMYCISYLFIYLNNFFKGSTNDRTLTYFWTLLC